MEADQKIDRIKAEKIKRARFSAKTIPWFMGFSNDLVFYIAINTLFLTVAKNLSVSQISFLTAVSNLSYIILQRPFLNIIKKIGNANSVRLGTILFFMGSIIITFAKSYYTMIIGQVLYTIAFLFKSMDNVMLKNNLTYLNKKDEYIKYKNKSWIIYSIVTTIVVLYAGYLFKINYYLPMYLCIIVCGINVIISSLLTDEKEKLNKKENTNDIKNKVEFSSVILLIMLSYGLFFTVISLGQTNVKLFIQYQLNDFFDIGLTATYFSYILFMSRVSRVVSNLYFYKIYDKVKDKIGYYLPILCGIAFVNVMVGCFIPTLFIKFILMSIGFCMILGTRDVFDTYMQDLLLKKAKVSEQQAGISYLN